MASELNKTPIRVLYISSESGCANARVKQLCDHGIQLSWAANRGDINALYPLVSGIDALLVEVDDVPGNRTEDYLPWLHTGSWGIPTLILGANVRPSVEMELLQAGAQEILDPETEPLQLVRSLRNAVCRQLKLQDTVSQIQCQFRQVEKQNVKLKELYDTAKKLVDDVSHEFRTPLSVIKEFAAVVQEGLIGEINSEQQRLLGIVEDRADDLNHMVDDLLDISKIEDGSLGVRRDAFQAEALFDLVHLQVEQKARSHDVELVWEMDDNIPSLYADLEKVGRVLINLAVNAVKFVGREGKVRIDCRWNPEGREAIVGVTDNGPGMSEDETQTIFQRFRQADAVKKGPKGFGLGLNIANDLVQLNFGELKVESEKGAGSCFSFSIPVADPNELFHRYIRQRQSVESNDSVHLLWIVPEAALDKAEQSEMNLCLQGRLRKHELLFHIPGQWLLITTEAVTDLAATSRWNEYIALENESRLGAAYPNIRSESFKSFSLTHESEQMLVAVRRALMGERESLSVRMARERRRPLTQRKSRSTRVVESSVERTDEGKWMSSLDRTRARRLADSHQNHTHTTEAEDETQDRPYRR